MGLVVPALRLLFVFLNIYESFKVLKLPRPSVRNGGQPSVRSMAQRKRDMKGVMTIWIVWCCYNTYERTLDSVIGIFVPFYDELKSLALMFFIVTRARGAEPIYLHVIRPMIKPYTATLDALLETTGLIGEFILILLAWPVHAAVSWYRRWATSGSELEDELQNTPRSETLVLGSRPVLVSNHFQQPQYRPHSNNGTPAEIKAPLPAPEPHGPDPIDVLAGHQIWYPPPPAYEQEQSDINGLTQFIRPDVPQLVRPPSDSHIISSINLESVEEWRRYPNFPSAYPPTPIAPPKSCKIIAPVPKRPSDVINFGDIPEEESSDSQPEGPLARMAGSMTETEGVQQGFQRSLLQPRESMNPGSDRHLSDENDSTAGVQIIIEGKPTEELNEDASSDEDGEASMVANTTLRTPRALSRGKHEEDMDISDGEQDSFDFRTPMPVRVNQHLLRPRPLSMVSVPSTSSWQSRSTTLSTTDGGSSLRTETESESESSKQSSPITGIKRPSARFRDSQATLTRVRIRAQPMIRSSSSGDAKPFPRRGRARVQVRRSVKTDNEDHEGGDGTDFASDASSTVKKRKIVAGVPRPRKKASAQFLSSLPTRGIAPSKAAPPAVRRSTRTVAASNDPSYT